MALQFIFSFLCVFSLSSQVLSRHLEQIPKTSYLDVSASIQQTIDILSFNPETLLLQNSTSRSAVELYSRDILEASRFKSYRDLSLSRLERDAFRIKYISNNVNLALGRDTAASLSAPLIAGTGEYYATIGFGIPSTSILTIVDSGSDVTWIQCQPCKKCYTQRDPIFDPSKSSTYELVSCNTKLCRELPQTGCAIRSCTYQVNYGDGSYTTGDLAKETLTFGNSKIQNVPIGCGHDNEGLFRVAGGLLGLGRGAVAIPSVTNTSVFSYCLVDKDSTTASSLELGPPTINSRNTVSAPLLGNSSSTFYYVSLTGIVVGAKTIPVSGSGPSSDNGVIVDSGTTVSRFIPDVYVALRDEFVKGTTHLPSADPLSPFDTCYSLKSLKGVEIPTVAFKFGRSLLTLPAKNILFPVGDGIFCFAFAFMEDLDLSVSIIGNIQQQGIRVSFDIAKSVVQFSPNAC